MRHGFEDYKDAHDRVPQPTFTFDWGDALIILVMIGCFLFLAWDVVKHS